MDSPVILIAPDSFKGTATAPQAADFLAQGVREIIPNAQLTLAPMADGGEGTAATFHGETITLPTTDAAGRLTEASYRFDAASATAYLDIAAASGLPAVADHPVPLTGDTYGTGVLIADALTRGATTIVLALGGSATLDGGTGILVALGAQPLDARGFVLPQGGGYLGHLSHIDTAQLNIPAAAAEWVLLSDVTSPATGPAGAATVYGPQKGASPEDIALLDAALNHFCEVTGIDPNTPGYGAAGAVPIGISWLSQVIHGNLDHVHLLPGGPTVADSLGIPALAAQADLVITGEGRLDAQSFRGKVVGTIAELTDRQTPLMIVAAQVTADHGAPAEALIVPCPPLGSDGVAGQLVAAGREAARRFVAMRR